MSVLVELNLVSASACCKVFIDGKPRSSPPGSHGRGFFLAPTRLFFAWRVQRPQRRPSMRTRQPRSDHALSRRYPL